MTRRNQHYPPELRERAVWMVAEVTPNYDSQWAAIGAVAQKLGVGTAEAVRKWVRQAEVDAGQRPGTTSDESAEIKRLKREVAELRRANEILKAASGSSREGFERYGGPCRAAVPADRFGHALGLHGEAAVGEDVLRRECDCIAVGARHQHAACPEGLDPLGVEELVATHRRAQ